MTQQQYKVVIVGGGTAGISVAARLVRANHSLKNEIVIIDPANKHYYQPIWTLVGAGVVDKELSGRDMESLIPEGVSWIQEAVESFNPEDQFITTQSGNQIKYEYLVVAAGIRINWDKIKGLRESLQTPEVGSNYSYETVDNTWNALKNFKGGTAIFTHPNTPIKCGGAPQKIMYLADDYFRKVGVRNKSNIIFSSANPHIFQVKRYADTLDEVVKRKQIQTKFKTNLTEIDPEKKEVVLEHQETGDKEVLKYDFLHVTPPMEAPTFIKNSPLSDEKGWVDVDPYTLQHKKYSNVFGIGDCSNLPTSKTGAAIRKQSPVVEENLLSLMHGKPLTAHYDGYSSCPLVTGYNRLVLAEFDYNLNPEETFPIDQSKERFSMYLMKKELLPIIYWNGMMKGLM